MSIGLNLHHDLKRKAALVMLVAIAVAASIATLIHYQQVNTPLINKVAPPLILVSSVVMLIHLHRRPESLSRLASITPLMLALLLILPSWVFIITAAVSPSTPLVEQYPPLTAPLFLWTTVTLIFTKPQHLLKVVGIGWLAGAVPLLLYLLLHPTELTSPRGLDLFISFGPAMLIQIAMVLFYARLQIVVDRLSAERLHYYSKVIEEQAIRQQAMEHAFTQFHNGPLQSLAVLLRDVQLDQAASPAVFQRLAQLNDEIREVGQSLTRHPPIESAPIHPTLFSATTSAGLNSRIATSSLRLGTGTNLDLTLPLHRLLHEVYSATLSRNLPHFQGIRVKVRNFAPLETIALPFDLKRDLCLWLEEALCNVGKHAQGATRIQVTGTLQADWYSLTVKDNGLNLNPGWDKQGTQQSHQLAQRLGGQFRREALPQGGVLCELAWPVTLETIH